MTTRPTDAYVPTPRGRDAEFFGHAVRTGVVHLQRCADCSAVQHPPRHLCGQCGSQELRWQPCSGEGSVHSWAMSSFTIDTAWTDRLPYATVVVDVDGVRLVGSYSGDDDELLIGMGVRVRAEVISDAFAYIWFDPVRKEAS